MISIMRDLTKGLLYAHSRKIYHNDLSDNNCFVCETQDGIIFKLGDWGSVKLCRPIDFYQKGNVSLVEAEK